MKTDLACFCHGYLVLYIFCSQCLFRRFLNEFSVPANTMFGGKLFQLLITLDCFTTSLRGLPTEQHVQVSSMSTCIRRSLLVPVMLCGTLVSTLNFSGMVSERMITSRAVCRSFALFRNWCPSCPSVVCKDLKHQTHLHRENQHISDT